MIVSIHQPAYLPWLGYFDKIRRSDLFLYLDSVQFQKGSFQNRNKIRSKDGPVWLTVPVEIKGKLHEHTLAQIAINNRIGWQAKHWSALKMNYSRAAYSADRLPAMYGFYEGSYEHLSELCWEMLVYFNRQLRISTPMQRTSAMANVEGAKSELVLNLCRSVGATTYLSGALGRGYLDEKAFSTAGINIVYQSYQHPLYRQAYEGFEPAMGVIDLLLNEDDPGTILRGNGS